MLAISALFSTIFYLGQQERFQEQRTTARKRYSDEFAGLLDQAKRRLEQTAALIPAMQWSDANKHASLRQSLDQSWFALQVNTGVDQGRLFDAAGRVVSVWGSSSARAAPGPIPAEVLHTVISEQKSQSFLRCAPVCVLHALAPVMTDGNDVGAFELAASLADVIVDFRKFSGVDIGLLYADAGDHQSPELRRIARWGVAVDALSNARTAMQVLLQLAAEAPEWLHDGLGRVQFDDRDYEVWLVPTSELTGPGTPRAVILEDITDGVTQVVYGTWRTLAAWLTGSLIFTALLLMLLTRPLARLTRYADILPMLGRGEFASARQMLAAGGPARRVRNELDLLDATAISLSHRLELLEAQVAERTVALQQALEQVRRDQEFASGLLETAQIIIMAHEAGGRLVTLNRYGERLLGGRSGQLAEERELQQFLAAVHRHFDAAEDSDASFPAAQNHYRQETEFRRLDSTEFGRIRHHRAQTGRIARGVSRRS